jgi:hypothetical protein
MALFETICLYDYMASKAVENGYIFIAGQGQWTNLEHVTSNPDDVYLIFEETSTSFLSNGIGGIDGYSFTGQFYLVKHDDLSTDYEYKYVNIIKPLRSLLEDFYFYCFSSCVENIEVKSAKILDLVNYLDCNFTGAGIDYVIEWRR